MLVKSQPFPAYGNLYKFTFGALRKIFESSKRISDSLSRHSIPAKAEGVSKAIRRLRNILL
ncbi:MAG TPA: hypothetical protein DET40_06830 [Lentisphaeria bacterium]|nr:MAG: hypothetical protein A2X45_07470 [Lentisphaerae bacterium GWF2_50_93]HCE43244.1 hypothetical protein [Lentisphaeria bacterium]